MRCGQCSFDNPDGMQFCGQCGTSLQKRCPACEFENPPQFKFCGNCGTSLDVTTEAPAIPETPAVASRSTTDPVTSAPYSETRAHKAERRQLTVMFCDLAGSTTLSGRLDPEDLREVVRAYQSICSDTIVQFDGHIAQYQGDGILVYFGYPRAHEDDARRAVQTGLEIVKQMHLLNERLDRDYHVQLAVRVGIHTGLVVVGDMGSGDTQAQLALGETPIIAAGIESVTEHNSVGISGATHRLVQDFFTVQALGEKSLKGVSSHVSVYRVSGEEQEKEQHNMAVTHELTSLIGRETEELLLQERWEEVMDGRGHVILISGEAGIGKSRLVQGMKDRVEQTTGTWLLCRCSPFHQHSMLFPLIDLWQRLFHLNREDTPQEKLRKLEERLTPYMHVSPDIVPLFAALLGIPTFDRYPPLVMSNELQHQKTKEAMLSILLEMEADEPVLFIVEDLQWMDPTTRELLDLIVDQGPGVRILTLCTYRPGFSKPWTDRAHVSHLNLHRLPQHHIEDIVQQMTNGKPVPPEIIDQIVSKTDGVPLFVEELTKMVLESELLHEEEDRYTLTGPIPPLAIPATLQDSLMARLDSQSSVKEVIQLGASSGRSFTYSLIRAISQLDEEHLLEELNSLVEAELLYQQGVPPRAVYHFKHTLIQETAYQSLLKSTRQQYHHRIVQALKSQFPEMTDTQPELLAYHYTAAGLSEQAIACWQTAGRQALQQSADIEAHAHFQKGLDVIATLPETPERAKLELSFQIALGPVVMAIKGQASADVERIYARARTLCRQVGETEHLFPALWGIWRFHLNRGELQPARSVADQLLHLAKSDHDPGLLVESRIALGTTLSYLGELVSAHEQFEEALSLYDTNPHQSLAFLYGGCDPGVYCRAYTALSLWRLGYQDQALQRSREAIEQADNIGHPYSRVFALHYAAVLHRYRREATVVLDYAEAEITLASEQGFSVWGALGTILSGWAHAEQGALEEGITQMQRGLDAYLATGASLARPWLGMITEAYGKAGQTEKGLQMIEDVLTAINESQGRYWESEMYCLKGELQLQHGDTMDAESSLNHAIEIAREQQAPSLTIRPGVRLSRLWQTQGKTDDARELLSTIFEQFSEGFETPDLVEAQTLLDMLD